MNRFSWWLVDLVSRGLDRDERDAVRGDLAESGETGGQALYQVLGLILRRQVALWMHWRPWTGLALIAVPLGIFFCAASKTLAYGSAIYLWLYANYWSPVILEHTAYRHDFLYFVGMTLLHYGTLAGLAWVSGFALGFVSRRSLPLNGLLFGLLLFFSEILYVPDSPGWVVSAVGSLLRFFRRFAVDALHLPVYGLRVFGHNYHSVNAVVFEHAFYRILFPILVQIFLVLLPSLWGTRQSMVLLNRHKEHS